MQVLVSEVWWPAASGNTGIGEFAGVFFRPSLVQFFCTVSSWKNFGWSFQSYICSGAASCETFGKNIWKTLQSPKKDPTSITVVGYCSQGIAFVVFSLLSNLLR